MASSAISKLRNIAALTFDVTDTLIHVSPSAGHWYSKGFVKYFGVRPDEDKLNRVFGGAYKSMMIEHPNFGAHTGITSEAWWHEVIARVCEKLKDTNGNMAKVNVHSAEFRRLSTYLYDQFKSSECWAVYDESDREVLKRLRDSGRFQLGVVSNFDERLHIVLQNMRLSDNFHTVIASRMSGVMKPKREIFQLALADLTRLRNKRLETRSSSLIEPETVAHISSADLVEVDCAGALNSGMHSILVTRDGNTSAVQNALQSSTNELYKKHAHRIHILPRFDDLLPLLL